MLHLSTISYQHIGQYRATIPLIGTNSGLIAWIDEHVSFRISYYGKCYFDKEKVYGNDIFFGFGMKIIKPKKK